MPRKFNNAADFQEVTVDDLERHLAKIDDHIFIRQARALDERKTARDAYDARLQELGQPINTPGGGTDGSAPS